MVPSAIPEPPTILFEKSNNLSDFITFHQPCKDIKFYININNLLKILHHLEGKFDVTETAFLSAIVFYHVHAEHSPPYDVVT